MVDVVTVKQRRRITLKKGLKFAVVIVAVAVVVAAVVVLVAHPGNGMLDTLSDDVTYSDQARTEPIASVLTFDVNNSSSKNLCCHSG